MRTTHVQGPVLFSIGTADFFSMVFFNDLFLMGKTWEGGIELYALGTQVQIRLKNGDYQAFIFVLNAVCEYFYI